MPQTIKVYRLVEYEGPVDEVQRTLEQSLYGTAHIGHVRITASEIVSWGITEAQHTALERERKAVLPGWPGQQQKTA